MSQLPFQPIAITGLSAMFPQARTIDEFWRLILSGRDCMQEIPSTHWLIEDYFDADPKAPVKTYSKHGAFLKDVPFDPVAYGIPPNMLPATDIAQILALMLARQVLEDCSGGQIAKLKLDNTSLILGVASATEMISSMSGLLTRPMWIEGMRRAGIPEPQVQEAAKRITALFPEWTENTFPGSLGNVVAGRVANRFNFGGTSCVTDAACASSLAALHLGISELQLGTSDAVVTGGVDALNTIFMYMCFSKTPAMSASGKCRPFAQGADGTMMGEGGGMLALRRLEDAERDGDRIYAVIRGLGSSSDGRSKSVYAPRPEGQTVALQRCYAHAGYSPATVRLVEAHGTGTAAGDLCEATALKEVFAAADASRRQWCALGSVKSQIGHTKGAAGTAGVIKVALALRHRALPPTANVDTPNPELGFAESPFYLNTASRPWIQAGGEPRRGSVSSFGFGGTNFHVALEEYLGTSPALRVRGFGAEVFLAGGANPAELAARVTAWATAGTADFSAAARSSQQEFDPRAACRAAIAASSWEDLAAKAGRLAERINGAGRGPQPAIEGAYFSTEACAAGAPGLVYLFPGQGSQSVGMAGDVAIQFEPAMQVWEKVEGLRLLEGERLCDVVYPPPAIDEAEAGRQEEKLRRTENAQPALGAVSLGYLAVLEAAGLRPGLVGGHSFGEIPALHAAGAISADELLRISRKRGELMAAVSRAHPGAMTAVWHPAEELAALLTDEFSGCVIANHNSPQQSVIAGPVARIEALEARCADRGISFRRLPVATAFHSAAVRDACEPFAEFLAGVPFAAPRVPVFNNTTAQPYPAEADAMRAMLAGQLAQPVRFADQLRAMQAAGGRIFVEVGAGAVLSGLARQTLGDGATIIALNPAGQPADVGLLCGLARLAVAGVPVAWDSLWQGHRVPPTAPKLSSATLPVGGYNLGRPYPPRDGVKTPPVTAPTLAPATAPTPKPLAGTHPGISRMHDAPVPAHQPPPSSRNGTTARPIGVSDAVVRAHETFLRTMGEAHRTFLETAGGPTPHGTNGSSLSAPAPAVVRSAPPASAPVAYSHAGNGSAPGHEATRTMPAPPSSPPRSRPVAPAPAPIPVSAPLAATAVAAKPAETFDSAKVIQIVLETVAEKTGYPREMLEPAMQLEGDLGIDSIKRVEILSAVQKSLPGLPPVDAKIMSGLQTLQAISDYLTQQLGGETKPVEAKPAAAIAPAPATTPTVLPASKSATASAELPVRRHRLRAEAAAAPGFSLAGLHRVTRLVITDDGRGIAAELRAALAAQGIAAEVVTPVPADCDGLILLEGLRADATPAAAMAVHQAAFAAARVAAGRIAETGGIFVTAQDTGGSFGLGETKVDRGWLGGFAGLAKTAAKEWPRAAVRSIDLECGNLSPRQLGQRLADELLYGGDEREIGLAVSGARNRLVLAECPAELVGNARITAKSVVVATGGARGVTASALVALARAHQPRIALLGRTALGVEPAECAGIADESGLRQALLDREVRAGRQSAPKALAAAVRDILAQREIRATLERLRAAGSIAEYLACDATDLAGVAAALAQVRERLGPITALVHGAGVLADKLIAEKTPEQFARVFDTKVRGLQVLLEATAADALDVVVLFSSVAGRFGNRGQADYAMANEVLNKVAQAEFRRRGGRCLVRSINWGPWDGGMVTPALREHFRAQGVGLIPHDEGATAFVRECAGAAAAGDVEVVIGAGRLDLAADPGQPSHRVEIVVSVERYPFLRDHVVKGKYVVPLALVAEWFFQAALLARPESTLRSLRDVQVMKAVLLEDAADDHRLLELTARPRADGTVDLRIAEARTGRAQYSAVADYRDGVTAPLAAAGRRSTDWREFGFKAAEVYNGRLFHGPEFQVILDLGGWSRESAALTLENRPLSGPDPLAWRIGPALLDGALQAAVLWTMEAHGKSSLPLRIAELFATRPARAGEVVSCQLIGRDQAGLGTATDIDCVDAGGKAIFSLRGVECFQVDSFSPVVAT
jgi:acyl transferase domain-containing protein/NADP-dependent 3-hydroxy acid dehydrogenase YdfG/acyl carrier protein